MYHGLRIQQEELDRQISAMQSGDQAWGAVQRLRELAAVMLTESGDWKILYQTHEVHAG
jgi:hypothetical protein